MFVRSHLKKCIQKEGYYERWNNTDKIVRPGQTLDSYLGSVRSPNLSQRWQLYCLCKHFKNGRGYKETPIHILFFDPKFEGGMPHTHGPYIMLPYNFPLRQNLNTIFHESVHVYQRYHPCKVTDDIVNQMGIPITGLSDSSNNLRANPDTNSILYGDFRPSYLSNAKSLHEISDKRDHVFEKIAYANESAYK